MQRKTDIKIFEAIESMALQEISQDEKLLLCNEAIWLVEVISLNVRILR